jgi:hypothetical protein
MISLHLLPITVYRMYKWKMLFEPYLSSLDFIAFCQHFVQYNLVTDYHLPNLDHVEFALILVHNDVYIVLIRMDFQL